MSKKMGLTKLLDNEKLAKVEWVFREHFQLGLEVTDTRGKMMERMCSRNCRRGFVNLCGQAPLD